MDDECEGEAVNVIADMLTDIRAKIARLRAQEEALVELKKRAQPPSEDTPNG